MEFEDGKTGEDKAIKLCSLTKQCNFHLAVLKLDYLLKALVGFHDKHLSFLRIALGTSDESDTIKISNQLEKGRGRVC